MKRKRHDIHVTSALLNADLTDGQKMVYIAIRSRQGEKGTCTARQRTLADDIGCHKSRISRSVQVLEEKGWITIEGGDIWCHDTPQKVARSTTEGPEGKVAQSATEVAQKATGVARSATESCSIRNSILKPTMKANNESQRLKEEGDGADAPSPSPPSMRVVNGAPEDEPDPPPEPDWKHEYAAAALARLRDLGTLSRAIQRKDEADVLKAWADEFRLIHEQDGYSKSEIRRVMRWLLTPDNWWIKNGNVRSVGSLRKKNRTGEGRKFDTLFDQMKADGRSHDQPTEDEYAANVARIHRLAESA